MPYFGFGQPSALFDMMCQSLFLKILLSLSPETSHHLALNLLRHFYNPAKVKKEIKRIRQHPVKISNIEFPNPVGLAAGLDKDGRCLDAWFGMGFGFIEVGTVTPKPQPGNPKPRLFRIKQSSALINRMGFNNEGVDALLERLQQRKVQGVVGVNIGKNKDTPLEQAVEDYKICLEKVYPFADYITVNISSPNTPGLRELQGEAYLDDLLGQLMALRNQLSLKQNRLVPIWVKIAPDLLESTLTSMLDLFLKHKIDAVIATNTLLDKSPVAGLVHGTEMGGLSGAPIYPYSKRIIKFCVDYLATRIPVIAVGGIDSPDKALEILALGAAAVQVYTGFIYQGPSLVRNIISALDRGI